MRIFVCGDVMIGRGVDQILPAPCPPALHERFVDSALDYVRLAERASGRIPRDAEPSYIWGQALAELARSNPDVRLVNLETSITRCEAYERKGINYRVSPQNAACLASAGIDCCALANNHVLDWTRLGLRDTLDALDKLHIKACGAGRNLAQARAPAMFENARGERLLVFAFASTSSGVPPEWGAGPELPGVNLLQDLSEDEIECIAEQVRLVRRPNDTVLASIHWGPNWGYEVPATHRRFAHKLVDRAGVSIVHGHSSHHAKGIELYKNSVILYGCGDFINDYEGIEGHEEFRGDLAAMYFVEIDALARIATSLELVPLRLHRFQLVTAAESDIDWLQRTLDRESGRFDTRILRTHGGRLAARAVHAARC